MVTTTQIVRPRGRPPVGERIAVRLPAPLLEQVDLQAAAAGVSRASIVRRLLTQALSTPAVDGVDRAQIRRMRALSPRDRIHHMADVARRQTRWRGAARPGPR